MMIIGRKIGMTQLFEDSGRVVPVTVIEAGPCPVVQVKTPEHEGYAAVQIGFAEQKPGRTSSPLQGHFKRAGVAPQSVLSEMRVEDPSQYSAGDSVDVAAFEGVGTVHVTGVTKGRGFAGTVRRHNFRIGRRTHGNTSQREPGSVGNCASPSRIFKGKRMPGRMGGVQRTARNLTLFRIDAEKNLLFIKGSVPGANNGIVVVRAV